jgi:hypothetical protein
VTALTISPAGRGRRPAKGRHSLHMNGIVRAAGYAALIAFAYGVAIIGYAGVHWVAALPGGELWDESWRAPARFLILILMIGAFLLPALRTEGDGTIRTASVVFALSLAAYSALKISGLADPDVPEMWVLHHLVDPLRRFGGAS